MNTEMMNVDTINTDIINNKIFNLIKNKNYDEFIKLIKNNKNIDLDIYDKNYNYVIQYLVLYNSIPTVKYILENGRVVMEGSASELSSNEDVKEFYLGLGEKGRKSYKDTKNYRRRKRWLT